MGILGEIFGIGRSGEVVDEAFEVYFKKLRETKNSKDAFLTLSNEIYKNLLIHNNHPSYTKGVKAMTKQTYNKLSKNHNENTHEIWMFSRESIMYAFHDKYTGRPELMTLLDDRIREHL